jgi:hypothetical protein
MSELKIKNFKLYILQYRYKYLSEIILKLEKHIDNLFINNFLDLTERNNILGSIFAISKSINIEYNQYITNSIDNICELDKHIADYSELFNELNFDFVCEQVFKIIKNITKILPLYNEENDLMNIMSDYGYNNLLDLIDIFINNKFTLTNNQKEIINEISNIFVPTKINYYNVSNYNNEYFWRVPSKYSENDILCLTREIWIKNTSTELEYLKLEGYFINDSLSCLIKTSQITYQNLYKLKCKITSKISKKINSGFYKKIY